MRGDPYGFGPHPERGQPGDYRVRLLAALGGGQCRCQAARRYLEWGLMHLKFLLPRTDLHDVQTAAVRRLMCTVSVALVHRFMSQL